MGRGAGWQGRLTLVAALALLSALPGCAVVRSHAANGHGTPIEAEPPPTASEPPPTGGSGPPPPPPSPPPPLISGGGGGSPNYSSSGPSRPQPSPATRPDRLPAMAGDGGAETLPPPPAATGDAAVYCDATGGTIPAALCDRISLVKSRLRPGSAAYNVPPSMVVGQTATVRLSMNRQAGSAAPAAAVGTLDGRTVTFAPMVGQFMRAELAASPATAFVIKASRAERQDLGAADSAVWEWSVTAMQEGEPRLIVRTWVVLDASSETPVSIADNPDQVVAVTVTTGQRLTAFVDGAILWLGKGTNLLKALAAAIAAAGAVWLAVRKLRAS